MKKSIYLDYAAATPLDPAVLAAMEPFFSENFYNPSATYKNAQAVKSHLEIARSKIAQLLGVRPIEIIFTAGATEANNIAIQGILGGFKDANVVISAIEHESIIEPAKLYPCSYVSVNNHGIVDIKKLIAAIDEKTVLISVMYANNEIGTVEPLRKIAADLKEIRKQRLQSGNKRPLYFHTDAAQAANYLDLHPHSLGVDLMSLNGGKIYGPKQSGILYVANHVKLNPLILGGGQELGIRNGTENVAADIGFTMALELAQAKRSQESARLLSLQSYFIQGLTAIESKIIVNGSQKQRLPNNVHVTFPGVDNERLLIELDEAGIMAAAGSACSASSEKPSHVLSAIGLSDKQARSSVRFSMGKFTTKKDIDTTLDIVGHLVK